MFVCHLPIKHNLFLPTCKALVIKKICHCLWRTPAQKSTRSPEALGKSSWHLIVIGLYLLWSMVSTLCTTHLSLISVPCAEAILTLPSAVVLVNANVRHCKSSFFVVVVVESSLPWGGSVPYHISVVQIRTTYLFFSEILGGRTRCKWFSKSYRAHSFKNSSLANWGCMKSNDGKQSSRVIAFKINISWVQNMHDGCLPGYT